MEKHRMLMIEDDMDDRYITETYFTDNGYDITLEFFNSAGDIIHHLDNLQLELLPHLVVLDPGKTGYGALMQLKAHPRFKEIPVVVVSESTERGWVKEAYRLGANSFIQKPSTHQLTNEKIGTFAKYWFDVVEL
jgi:CheY-like chemotaxis protein